MKKIKVSEVSGVVLDWMVAKCEGIKTDIPAWADKPWVRCTDDNGVQFVCPKFSTDWAQGGPIIERERITIRYWDNDEGVTAYMQLIGGENTPWHHGPTAMISAMRCYVASKLGEEVKIPEEIE